MKLKNLNLKYLIKAHTNLGLFALFFFYISAFFGTITLFKPQIHMWENPSRYFVKEDNYNFTLDELVNRTIQEEGFSTKKVEVILPSYKDDVIAINDPASRTKYINPYTLKMLDTTSDSSFLHNFFNDLHVGRNIPKVGQLLMGIASILMIFLILSGVMLFINKHKAKQTFNFKWHRDLSLFLLPYIIIFSLTGAVLGFMLNSSSLFAYSASKGEVLNMRALVAPVIFPRDKIPEKTDKTKMLNIDTLMQKAQNSYKNLEIKRITLLQWNDKNAKIKFSGFLKDNRILTGRINRQYIVLSGVDGSILDKRTLDDSHGIKNFLSGFYFFHFLPDETSTVRIIFAFLGIAFLISLAFGFLIYSNKKAQKYKSNLHYYSFLNRFSIAIMFGIIPATALCLLLYWAIPKELFERIIWIKGCFYAYWAFTLFLSTYFEDVIDLLKSLCFQTSAFLFATIIAHIMKASEYLVVLTQSEKMHPVLYVDLTILILSVIFFLLYKYMYKIKFLTNYSRISDVS